MFLSDFSGKEGGLLEPGQFWKYQIEGDNTWIEDPTLTVTGLLIYIKLKKVYKSIEDMELETIVASIKLGLEQIRVYHIENNI